MLDGHTSSSTPHVTGDEMVGSGARRKVSSPLHAPINEDQSKTHTAENISVTPWTISHSAIPGNNFKKRERRHIYHDIVPLRNDDKKNIHEGAGQSSNTEAQVGNCLNSELKSNKSIKPAIPPKPKYILRDKRQRHVYQTIDLQSKLNGSIPPPLPNKPPRLQYFNKDGVPPPLPPRVVNDEAVKQRYKLDQEYFENLRKSVDEHLLNLAEADDLPVPIQHNIPSGNTHDTRRHNYGAHSPPLTINPTDLTFDTALRRHSLPLYESIPDVDRNATAPPIPNRPVVRTFSNENDTENNDIIPHELPVEAGVNTNLPHAKLAENLLLLKKCGWYWGNMTWQEAEALLTQKEGEGVFLMRDSQNPLHLLTITVRSTTNTVHHIRVEYCEGKFQLYEPGRAVSRSAAQCVRHSNIEQFIKLAVKHSISGSFLYFLKPKNMGEPPVQIRLLTPISRMSKIKSLKYMCRMTIRNCVVAELIPSISVPPKIQQYLMSGPYYDTDEDL
uniref:uncharacterized protein LOC120336211 n=1 Tax=Styela clava TaxID=7725 RepID=UPI001939AEFE|nr:uncharacterized protein LOC120336211 [Styela clava]XP_039259769.1 uncharacterized protein LOC120336211 [Styela clava]